MKTKYRALLTSNKVKAPSSEMNQLCHNAQAKTKEEQNNSMCKELKIK